jgi:hypothetical protein
MAEANVSYQFGLLLRQPLRSELIRTCSPSAGKWIIFGPNESLSG